MSADKTESKTSVTAAEDFETYFKENFRLTCCGTNLWRAYNKATSESASPVYNSKEAAIHYVRKEIELMAEEAIHEMLGGDSEHIRGGSRHD